MSKPKKNLEKARQIKGLGNSGLKNIFKKLANLLLIFRFGCANIVGQSKNALLAQLDRVFGYEPKGQGFESLTARHNTYPYLIQWYQQG